MLKVFALLVVLFLWQPSAVATGLEGYVQMDVGEGEAEHASDKDSQGEPKLEAQTAKMQSYTENPPTWIKGKVFSNDDMLMYSFWQIAPFKKEYRWAIPGGRVTTIKLRAGVVQYWKGYKPDGPCRVVCVPMGPGKFKFHHARPDGPRGYLERLGDNEQGFPKYRFWFEDKEGAGSAEENQSDSKDESDDTGK